MKRLPARGLVFASLLLLVVAGGFAAESGTVVLQIPGAAESTVTAETLRAAALRDVVLSGEHGQSVSYRGVPLLAVLEKVGLETSGMPAQRTLAAAMVVATARDGYTVVFSVGELMRESAEPRVFLAAETASGALPAEQGPVRLVVTGERARSAFGLAKIEVRFVAQNPPSRKSG